jgi:hypothetical protein
MILCACFNVTFLTIELQLRKTWIDGRLIRHPKKIFVAAGFSLRDIGTMLNPRKLKLAATKKHK